MRVRVGSGEVGRHRCQRRNVGADQENLPALDGDVGLANLRAAAANRLYFPSEEHETGFVALLDEVIVARLAVLDDGHRGGILP